MKSNRKKISLAKLKSIISHRKNNSIEIPKDAPESVNLFIKDENKKSKIKLKKNKTINITLKDIIIKQLPEYIINFDGCFRNYYDKTKAGYKIKYNVLRFNKDNILLRCSEKNCGIKAKLKLLSNSKIGIPDPDGNIFEINEEINNIFTSEEHKLDLNVHKESVKCYIFENYANLTQKEVFNKENNYIQLKFYCRQYFLNNPDKARDDALTELAKTFETNYNEEINLLSYMLYLGKQYIYDNPDKVNNYVFKLEDIEDNEHNKICKAFPYKTKTEKTKNIWLIITNNMKKNIANYRIK